MLRRLRLHNFKSARNLNLVISPITVLSGLNGSGKSSVLQSLALVKQSLDVPTPPPSFLFKGPLVQLGKSDDVWFEDADDERIEVELTTDAGVLKLSANAVESLDVLPVEIEGPDATVLDDLYRGFQFIQADRIVPAIQFAQASSPARHTGWLGCRGEFCVDFLARKGDSIRVSGRRTAPKPPGVEDRLWAAVAPTDTLIDQVSAWMQSLSPGVMLRTSQIELADSSALRFEYASSRIDVGGRQHRPTNVGFGLTYVLPIVVACLAAPEGSLLLLENPEAHLHPRGQTALGQLLARCAADGVQIVVETHSDHLLNGVRIAVKRGELPPRDAGVHFFERDADTGETNVSSPTIYANGKLSEWPEGFFDEWSRALDELIDV